MPSPDLQPKPDARYAGPRAASAAPRRGRAGLTLIELAVTMTVLLLAAVVVAPSFLRFLQASQLQWAARRVMGLAGEARGLAVSGDRVMRLEYDPKAHGMQMSVDQSEEDDADAAPALPGTEPPVGERRTPDTRMLLLPLDVNVRIERDRPSEDSSIQFFPDGRSEDLHVRLEETGFPPVVLTMNARTGRLQFEEEASE